MEERVAALLYCLPNVCKVEVSKVTAYPGQSVRMVVYVFDEENRVLYAGENSDMLELLLGALERLV